MKKASEEGANQGKSGVYQSGQLDPAAVTNIPHGFIPHIHYLFRLVPRARQGPAECSSHLGPHCQSSHVLGHRCLHLLLISCTHPGALSRPMGTRRGRPTPLEVLVDSANASPLRLAGWRVQLTSWWLLVGFASKLSSRPLLEPRPCTHLP